VFFDEASALIIAPLQRIALAIEGIGQAHGTSCPSPVGAVLNGVTLGFGNIEKVISANLSGGSVAEGRTRLAAEAFGEDLTTLAGRAPGVAELSIGAGLTHHQEAVFTNQTLGRSKSRTRMHALLVAIVAAYRWHGWWVARFIRSLAITVRRTNLIRQASICAVIARGATLPDLRARGSVRAIIVILTDGI